MIYRTSEKMEIRPSLLGFGSMRFPTNERGTIDTELATAMLDYAIENGVNYFDTAYLYHKGESEPFLAKALARYPRDSYYMTSKLPTTKITTFDDAVRIYEDQKTRRDNTYLDIYMLHNVNGKRWQKMVDLGVVDYLLERRAAGDFRYFGFSFHGKYKEFETILTARDWDVCQIQLNYMDINEQCGIKGYELAEQRGVPVIIMEPVKGGALANPPEDVQQLMHSFIPDASPASWALRWVASHKGVLTVLSGMSSFEQVTDNVRTFRDFTPLNENETDMLLKAADMYRNRLRNKCTTCQYCMPCPSGINIPLNFKLWNEYAMYGKNGLAMKQWKAMNPARKGDNCIECRSCEAQCPQGLSIVDDLKKAVAEMDQL